MKDKGDLRHWKQWTQRRKMMEETKLKTIIPKSFCERKVALKLYIEKGHHIHFRLPFENSKNVMGIATEVIRHSLTLKSVLS